MRYLVVILPLKGESKINRTQDVLPDKYFINGKEVHVTWEFNTKGPNVIDVLIDIFLDQQRKKKEDK